jgi:arabinofuranosyltransferase
MDRPPAAAWAVSATGRVRRAAGRGVTRRAGLVLAPLGVALLLPFVVLVFSRIEIIDDAYISARYALNLSRGNGLVFNLGERVEGVTDLLWTLLLAAPLRLGVPFRGAAAAMGTALGLLAEVEAWRLCRRLGVAPWAAAGAVTVLALYPGYWLTTASGLEGGLFAFLLVRTVSALVAGAPRAAGGWGGLLFLTRPESLLALPLAGAYQLWRARAAARPWGRMIRECLVPLLVPWLALIAAATLWRLWYYGVWLPNSVTAKAPALGSPALLVENVLYGLRYEARFAAQALPLAAAALLAPLVAPRVAAVWLGVALLGAEGAVVLANGGDWMPNSRLLSVYAPLLAVLLAVVLQRVAGGGAADAGGAPPPQPHPGARRRGGALAALALACGVALMLVLPRSGPLRRGGAA